MKKGYAETLPKNSHDPQGMPIWGAPVDNKKRASAAEERRQAAFKRNSERPVVWGETIRTANSSAAGYQYINFEGLYKGFRQRLIEDPDFQGQILDLILDRLMSELYVPLNHRPQVGLKLKICRKPKDNET